MMINWEDKATMNEDIRKDLDERRCFFCGGYLNKAYTDVWFWQGHLDSEKSERIYFHPECFVNLVLRGSAEINHCLHMKNRRVRFLENSVR